MTTILPNLRSSLNEEFCLQKCKECFFITLAPLPDDQVLEKYYNRDYWDEESTSTSKHLNHFFALRMGGVVRELKRLIPENGRILDWGAGDGSFVRLLNKKGFSAYGIDKFSTACDETMIFSSTIHDTPFASRYFDCITSFHVLEHLKDPKDSVKSAFNLLKPGGIFICEVPNISSFQYNFFREKWQPLEIPFHVNHFSPDTLSKLFNDTVNSNIIKMSYFSHRVSPSALLLSIFPLFSPKQVRRKYGGRYPLILKIIYLLFQLAVYPLAMAEASFRRGGIVRFYLKKQE
ncbi:class I SAM-dependent methyltransferase [Thermodesulfobacteriota bacterium]